MLQNKIFLYRCEMKIDNNITVKEKKDVKS